MSETVLIPSPQSPETQVLRSFEVDATKLAECNAEALSLTLAGPTDAKGYAIVKRARLDLVKVRTGIKKTHERVKKDALRYCQIVDETKRTLIAIIAPGEEHLKRLEKIVTDEEARIKREAEEKRLAEQARIEREKREKEESERQAELDRLAKDRAEFEAQKAESERVAKIEADRVAAGVAKAREEAAKELAEAKRIAEEAAAIERGNLRKIEEAQRAEQEKLRQEREQIEADRKRLEDAERARVQAIEIEAARKRQEEQDKIDAEQRAEREAREAVERKAREEEEAKAEAARRAAMATDVDKMAGLLRELESVTIPTDLKSPEAIEVAENIDRMLGVICDGLRELLQATKGAK